MAVDIFQTALVGVALGRADPRLRPSLARMPRVLAAGAVAAALAFVPSVPAIVLAAAAGVVYVGLALLLRAVPDEVIVEARHLRARLRRT
jgi:hypothetical protein